MDAVMFKQKNNLKSFANVLDIPCMGYEMILFVGNNAYTKQLGLDSNVNKHRLIRYRNSIVRIDWHSRCSYRGQPCTQQ
jgi:hypothetical protein